MNEYVFIAWKQLWFLPLPSTPIFRKFQSLTVCVLEIVLKSVPCRLLLQGHCLGSGPTPSRALLWPPGCSACYGCFYSPFSVLLGKLHLWDSPECLLPLLQALDIHSIDTHYGGPDHLGPPPGERGLSRDTVLSHFKVRFRKEPSPRTQRCGHWQVESWRIGHKWRILLKEHRRDTWSVAWNDCGPEF